MFNTWLVFRQLCSRKAALLLQNCSGSKVDRYLFTFTHFSYSIIDVYSLTPVPLFYTYIWKYLLDAWGKYRCSSVPSWIRTWVPITNLSVTHEVELKVKKPMVCFQTWTVSASSNWSSQCHLCRFWTSIVTSKELKTHFLQIVVLKRQHL